MLTTLIAASALAKTTQSTPDTKFLEAFTVSLSATREAISGSGFGFRSGACVIGTYLEAGKSMTYNAQFAAGTHHIVIAGGNADAQDIDVELLDKSKGSLAKDDSKDVAAAVDYKTGSSVEPVTIKLTNAGSSAAYVVATVVVDKGGTGLSDQSFDDLVVKADEITTLVKDNKYSWGYNPGRMSIVGSMLAPGKTFAPSWSLATGNYTAVAFATKGASSIALSGNDPGLFDATMDDGTNVQSFDFPSKYKSKNLTMKVTNKKGSTALCLIGIVGTK